MAFSQSAKGRTNTELREKFILSQNVVGQGMSSFVSKGPTNSRLSGGSRSGSTTPVRRVHSPSRSRVWIGPPPIRCLWDQMSLGSDVSGIRCLCDQMSLGSDVMLLHLSCLATSFSNWCTPLSTNEYKHLVTVQ